MGTFPVGIIGILVILGLAFLLSNNKRAIRLRVVGAAFALQVAIAFIVLQLIMVSAVIAFPTLVTGGIEKGVTIDANKVLDQLQMQPREEANDPFAVPAAPGASGAAGASSAPAESGASDDPMKGLLESIKKEQGQK